MATGRVMELRRFPVKSMRGETPTTVTLDDHGVVGDRSHAVIDVSTGKVASAKDPRRWAGLLEFRAAYVADATGDAPIVLELPDGSRVSSDDPRVDGLLSEALGRSVRLAAVPDSSASYDDVWPDVDGLAPAELIDATQTDVTSDGRPVSTLPVGLMAPGTFQDVAPVTLLTTASLAAAARLAPSSRWDPRRFRTNILVELQGDGFIENDWVGRQLSAGEAVLDVTAPSPRCVMTTLVQEDLEQDRDILRTLARHNRVDVAGTGLYACLGVYGSVAKGGRVSVGDVVRTF